MIVKTAKWFFGECRAATALLFCSNDDAHVYEQKCLVLYPMAESVMLCGNSGDW